MDGGQLAAEGRPAAILAEERGWPIQWVDALLNSSKISKPVLPWSAEQSTKRGFALKVEEPFFSTTRKRWELVTVGYHQRFRASHGNAWCYVPHRPKSDKAEEFLEHLKELNRTVAALPFVIGPLNRTRLLVITEGQWDAISLYYAVTRNGSLNAPQCADRSRQRRIRRGMGGNPAGQVAGFRLPKSRANPLRIREGF